MTMEIEVKNLSTRYVAEVTEMDEILDSEGKKTGSSLVQRHFLKPGESVKVNVWDIRDLVVSETGTVKEVIEKLEKSDLEDPQEIKLLSDLKEYEEPEDTPEKEDRSPE